MCPPYSLLAQRVAEFPIIAQRLPERPANNAANLVRRQVRRARGAIIMDAVQTIEQVPRQAWLVRLGRGGLAGVAGTGVQRGSNWLFEGGWAWIDHPRVLRPGGVYLGSGAVWDGSSLSLIAPSHSADAVFVLQAQDCLYASNSLPFAMVGAGRTDLPLGEMMEAVHSLIAGLRRHRRSLYAAPDVRLYRFFNAVITCRPDEEPVETFHQPDLSGIRSFETYREYLISTIRQAGAAYGSTGISVYLSSGYDSTACAALAIACGDAPVAISLDRARSRTPDDGSAAARALGMRQVTLQRPNRRITVGAGHRVWEHATEADVERLSDFYLSWADECLSAPSELLAQRTVLTGFHGDKIWDPLATPVPDLERGDSSGSFLGEFRLRVGFLHIPVPMLAFGAHAVLKAIGLSKEMRPWRKMRTTRIMFLRVPVNPLTLKTHPMVRALGRHSEGVRVWCSHSYDRPIPRRIAEEAGVPREAFGQYKKAASTKLKDHEAIAPQLFQRWTSRYEIAAAMLAPAEQRYRA